MNDEIDPADVHEEVLYRPVGGGFAPLQAIGVRLTHRPTGVAVEETGQRSAHAARAAAWARLDEQVKQLRALNAALQAQLERNPTPGPGQVLSDNDIDLLITKHAPPVAPGFEDDDHHELCRAVEYMVLQKTGTSRPTTAREGTNQGEKQ